MIIENIEQLFEGDPRTDYATFHFRISLTGKELFGLKHNKDARQSLGDNIVTLMKKNGAP
jgi:hypothetical protein